MLAAGFIAFLAVRLWQLWRRDPVDLSHLDVGVALLAVVVSVLAVASYGVVWLYVLRRLRVPATARWITLFFKSQLGKYIPGSVWQYAGRVGLGRRYGLPIQTGVAAIGVEVVASSVAAGLAGLLVLSGRAAIALISAVIVVVASAAFFGRRMRARLWNVGALVRARVGVDAPLAASALRATPFATGFYLLVWLSYGLAFWLTARALFAVPTRDLPVYVGTFALAWLAGFVALFAPGGVGVREAVIVGLLTARLGEANAIVLAATSRLVLTGVDAVAGAFSFALPRAARPKELEVSG